METGSLFITSFIVAFSGAMMPGPLLTATINESYYGGWTAGPRLIMGHALLELFLLVFLVMGMGQILLLPGVKTIIAFVGGLFLFWMGWCIIRDAVGKGIKINLRATGTSNALPLEMTGILTSLSNPYWIIWWATVGLSYTSVALVRGFPGISAFFLGHIGADLVWYSLISVAIVSGKKILSDKVYCVILIISGLFLMGLSLFFIFSGINFLSS